MENQCQNCLKIFKFKYLLDRHMFSTRTCHKAEIVNGEIISDRNEKCEDCDSVFQNKYTLARHKKNNCKGKATVSKVNSDNTTTTTTTNSHNTDNSVHIDNSTVNNNNNNFNINIGVLNDKMKPKNEFKVVEKDLITMQNLDSYIKDFLEKPENCTYNNMIELIENILKDKYITNIDFVERNILSINKRREIHYYDKDGWKFDGSDVFYHACVIEIIEQLEKVMISRRFLINNLINSKKDIFDFTSFIIKKFDYNHLMSPKIDYDNYINTFIEKYYVSTIHSNKIDETIKHSLIKFIRYCVLECISKVEKYSQKLENVEKLKCEKNYIEECDKYLQRIKDNIKEMDNLDKTMFEDLNVSLTLYNNFCVEFLKTLMMSGVSRQVLSNMKKNFYANNELQTILINDRDK